MNRRHLTALVVAATVAVLESPLVGATAAPSSTVPTNYTIVSKQFSLAAHSVAQAGLSCPPGLRIVGGGVSGQSTNETITRAYPYQNVWSAVYQNPDSSDSGFTLYAVCMTSIQGYTNTLGFAQEASPGQRTSAIATCPTGTIILGGGGNNSSPAVTVNLNTSTPDDGNNFFLTSTTNAGTAGDATQALAVCGRAPTGYVAVTGSPVTVPANTQSTATAVCPVGTHVLSGGARSASSSTRANLNASYPDGTTGWRAYEDNFSSSSDTLTVTAVCAKTKA